MILESFTLGKAGDAGGGEDRIEVAGSFYGVFDGVTSRGRAVEEKLLIEGQTPGRWAARTLGGAVGSLPSDASAPEALLQMQQALLEGMARSGIDPEEWEWPAAAQTFVYSRSRRELWHLGDVSIAVNGVALPESPTPLDAPATGYRAAALWALLASGADVETLRESDPTWSMLLPLLELQHHLRNCEDPGNPFAYRLLDGRELPTDSLQVFPVLPGDEVVATTDGYISPAPTLEAAEAELALVLENDPLLIGGHRGFRPLSRTAVSFDDRAYLRFLVT